MEKKIDTGPQIGSCYNNAGKNTMKWKTISVDWEMG